MKGYYSGRRAAHYNRRWRAYTGRTLTEALAMIDIAALRRVPEQLGRAPRVLDIACGTGILLQRIIEQVPDIEAYGVDASADMLTQASLTLQGQPRVRLVHAVIGTGETASLPFEPGTFDLITCTNALHDVPEPAAALNRLRLLLAPRGQLMLEDFARREPPFPWGAVALLLRWIEGSYIRAYSLAEARTLCAQAGFTIICEKSFVIDWLWHGWALDVRAFSS